MTLEFLLIVYFITVYQVCFLKANKNISVLKEVPQYLP